MMADEPGRHPYVRDQEYDRRVTLGHDRSHLHQAASMGQLLMLHALIQDGARANVTTYNGVTPLHEACMTGHKYCAKALIKAGGQLNAMDVDWHTPLTRAASEGKKECIDLLIESGAKLNIPGEIFSPLHCAAAKGCTASTQALLDGGAEVDKLDNMRLGTPLHAASHCGRTECIRILLQAGASANARRPEDGQTPLHVAAMAAAPAASIGLLLQHGAKVHAKDDGERTALDLAPADSEGHALLKHYQEDVPLLTQLCKESVNACLSKSQDSSVQALPLPGAIKVFLDPKQK